MSESSRDVNNGGGQSPQSFDWGIQYLISPNV